ncbi:uncharacterized protein PFL1_05025 [Pseudozyma flocculosa PF-1]|uniref:Related to cop9 complex subunit 3 n=2 Tax=Pseudozyma flocculosa TaxID=84751 RepID=A0A5C3EVK5_9BASI|nr:uncharacterized protein PFL1_05025 [Pseudozyma flocculosa PF-1]EPQ27487.1 hypothetical protein PFL1_05025 [Pseudozyma flocculosa PF-1]SPO36082.1 related to cop9 complex subunit 3 [Pseudozyma flocculosa]
MSQDTSSSSSTLMLSSVEDVLALTLQCGDRLGLVQSSLIPALHRFTHDARIDSDALLARPVEGDRDPLGALSPAVNTVGYLYILTARLKLYTSQEQTNVHLAVASQFVESFNLAQARCVGGKVAQLARQVAELGDRIGDAKAVLPILEVLFARFTQDRPNSLTALHPVLAYQYLKSSLYQEAYERLLRREHIDVDVYALPNHTDVLEYFYYSGMILTKLKLHEQAIDSFETCISSPSAAVSAIQMDAYKKLVLVQLLAHGQTSPPPRYTAQVVVRSFKQLGAAYTAFATAYEARDADCLSRLEALVNQRAETFTQDCNFGLVFQCLELHRQRRIQRLGEVYSSLTLMDVAELLNIQGEDRERVVQAEVEALVSKGWITATIHPSASMPAPSATPSSLPSHDSPVIVFEQQQSESYETIETVQKLTAAIKRSQAIQRVVEQRERHVARSVEFLKKQAQGSRGNRYLDLGTDEFEDDAFAA